jgi:hypothetical protein
VSTPKHRRGAVERAPTDAASRSSRVASVSSDSPIYGRLVREMFPAWPDADHDPDSPTERFQAVQIPDEWFVERPEVEHEGPTIGSLFRHAMVGDRT